MTPPDSDYAEPCNVAGCIRRNGHAPPHTTEIADDSDARASNKQLEILRYMANLRARQDTRSGCEIVPEMVLRLVDEIERGRKGVSLPLSLAQRILAALEQQAEHYRQFGSIGHAKANVEAFEDLASELRALVTK